MAEDLGKLSARVFSSVLAPLVLGGPMQPAHPVGARAALALMDGELRPHDAELASRVDLARVVQARRLVPVDRVDDPTGAEWALGAVLHDLLQVANPGWVRRSPPKRLLDLTQAAMQRIPPVRTAHEALTRHTWFARLFAITRTDTAVSWWVGSQEYLGQAPPKRLFLWSELRRVHVERSARQVTELLVHGGKRELAFAFETALSTFLRATPLTDLASCARRSPPFGWSPETLALVRAPIARVLALRAVAFAPMDDVDGALGRATRVLFAARAWRDASTALDFLGHRAMAAAQESTAWPGAIDLGDDTAFARATGAMVARKWLDDPALSLSEGERRRLAPIFDAASRSSAARELAELSAPARATPL